MARIFNIRFNHRGNQYDALVYIKGGGEAAQVQVSTTPEHIQVMLPTGNLVLPISEVLRRVYADIRTGEQSPELLHITPTISLQLLNARW